MEKTNWCEFFAVIEADPSAIAPKMTVREFLAAREHLHSCDSCYNRALRVEAKNPNRHFPDTGVN